MTSRADITPQAARDLGSEHGCNAASWIAIDDPEAAERILDDLGDLMPSPLSGEWADDPTPGDVLREIADAAGLDYSDREGVPFDGDEGDELLGVYAEAFSDAFARSLEQRAVEYLRRCPVPSLVVLDGNDCRDALEDDGGTLALVLNEEGTATAARPLAWCNSARVVADAAEDSVTVAISTGDPRGAFAMTVRRIPTDADSPDAGHLVMHLPYPGASMLHESLVPLREGTYLIGAS